ncbi:MAG TPA: ATP-binding cassette domain-containing protein [Streptosporangiaceae bacterium]|jgi:ABC-2 type transport system ATP-binding protein
MTIGTVTAPPTTGIDVRGLVKVYPGGVQALSGLSFTVEAGTVFGLLGPNGAGKTTTVKILTTLCRATSGTARVAGVDVTANPSAVRQLIGCVPQRTSADFAATGRENLVLQGRLYRLGRRELRARAPALLEAMGLADAADRLVRTYSGGMQRRLDVALGLIHRPSVLFLDEPTAGLDPEARTGLWAEIERLAADEGLTVLLTTHHMEEADRLAARLAIVDQGRVVAEGSPQQLRGELRGDTVQVELAEPAGEHLVFRALSGLGGLHGIAVEGRSVSGRADSGATAVPLVLAALDAAGLAVASVTVARPSLDDVYLRHAGRSFRAADSGGTR